MFPVIGADAIAELVKIDPALEKPELDTPWATQIGLTGGDGLRRGAPVTGDAVRAWTGRMLWIAALCGGVFGLLGGWLVDRLGRKAVMVGSIVVYSFSPVAAAYSTELWQLILFRCTTFIGVCVEMVAAVTWLAELFEVKRTRELAIGWTLACASLGGILVTEVYNAIVDAGKPPNAPLPGAVFGVAFPSHDPANVAWRYTLLTGLVPGLLILLLMPFVPESRVWRERKRAGTLRRPSFAELFTPGLLRTTLVTALLSACAYAAAFGALQMTPSQIAPGLPDMAPKVAEVQSRGKDLAKLKAAVEKQTGEDAAAGKARIAESVRELTVLRDEVKARRGNIQRWQELGGLTGRILFALLLTTVPSRLLLRLFLVPGVVLFPLTYWVLRQEDYALFAAAIFGCGLLTVAQMSYMSEYLPKVFPVHLRGTGGGFATNVGARMIGTMAATLNTEFLANALTPGADVPNPIKVATAAGWIGGVAFAVALVLSFLLPPPRAEEPASPAPVGPDAG
ncbi:MAG: MFS transporter [Gemmataceae bacterium]|nr:MFS transporter [Gemmataceae bacterium]